MNKQKLAAAEAAVKEARKSLKAAEEALRKVKGNFIPNDKAVQPKKARFLTGKELVQSKNILRELITTDEWPEAIHPRFISNLDDLQQQLDRSRSVLEAFMEDSLLGKKFLDYGCGNGLTTFAAEELGAVKAVGYDIKEQDWGADQTSKRYCTVVKSEVQKNSPYDVILVHDVIDHLEKQTPLEFLADIKKNCSKDTIIHMRTHPMCSRHGCHTVYSINKAYSHLFFTKEELESIFNKEVAYFNNAGVLQPLRHYENLFKKAGFKILNYHVTKDAADPFFEKEPMQSFLVTKFNMSQFPSFQLSIAFVDYILTI